MQTLLESKEESEEIYADTFFNEDKFKAYEKIKKWRREIKKAKEVKWKTMEIAQR